MKMSKTLVVMIGLVANINMSYAQSVPMEHHGLLGFHPFRSLMHKAEIGAVAGVAGYGAYRYNQVGRSIIEQNAEPALQYYGTVSGETYLNNIRVDLNNHRLLGKHNLLITFSRLIAEKPQYKNNAIAILQQFGIDSASLQTKINNAIAVQSVDNTNEVAKIQEAEQEEESCSENESSGQKRNSAGVASGGYHLRIIGNGDKWFYGTNMNLALIPGQVANDLRGHPYKNFDEFRKAVWKDISRYPYLVNFFSYNRDNYYIIIKGSSPIVNYGQNNIKTKGPAINITERNTGNFVYYDWKLKKNPNQLSNFDYDKLEGNNRYHIHHIVPIGRGGKVYDFDNLVIVTPLMHCQMLDYNYHQQGGSKEK